MSIDEKLEKFQDTCLEMSNNDKKNLQTELDTKAKSKIEKELAIFKQKLETKFEKEKLQLEKDYNKKIIDLEFDSKKQLLDEDEQEKQQLFNECVQKLEAYTSTDEYIHFLGQILENTISYLENHENVTIYLTNRDAKKVDFKDYGKIETLEDTYIGGLMLRNDDMLIDNTLLTNLKEKLYGTKGNNEN